MVTISLVAFDHMISMLQEIEQMAGLECSRREVGRSRSLGLGFGQESRISRRLNRTPYREWEIGTYRGAWRVIYAGKVVCGSQDVVDSIGDLDSALQRVALGRFVSLRRAGDLDVRIEFDDDTTVDFLATIRDEDELLHKFGPDGRIAEFSALEGWRLAPADEPWPNFESDIPGNVG